MIKAILFDLDGVLVDACDWHYHSLNDALLHYVGFTISYKEHKDRFNGLPTSVKLKMLQINNNLHDDIWSMKQERTLYNIKKYGMIDKYKIKMHKNLISEGYTLACVTNSIKKTAIEMLKITGQEEFMSLLVSNEDVKNNKPHPDCYLYAMNKLSTSPEETLIIEDSPKGKQAALATGCSLLEVEDVYDVTLDKIRRFL
jgi:HAD superfamily hydrolase (TIGR01509 family)